MCVTGTFVDGLQLEKNGQKRLVQGRSVITIGHCATEVIMSYDKGGNGAQDRHEGEHHCGTISASSPHCILLDKLNLLTLY